MNLARFVSLGVAVSLLFHAASEAQPALDTWESPPRTEYHGPPCTSLDQSLIAALPADQRLNAIAMLNTVSELPLSQEQVSSLLELGGETTMASAAGRIKDAIEKLKEQKRLELVERVGSWGTDFQERLEMLQTMNASATTQLLKPYLVRAIAKNERASFFVSMCGNELDILHGSLGNGPAPPSIKLPVIVFLDRPPATVFATWAMAQ